MDLTTVEPEAPLHLHTGPANRCYRWGRIPCEPLQQRLPNSIEELPTCRRPRSLGRRASGFSNRDSNTPTATRIWVPVGVTLEGQSPNLQRLLHKLRHRSGTDREDHQREGDYLSLNVAEQEP